MVLKLITSADIRKRDKFFAAAMAIETRGPQAIMVTSTPFFKTLALPMAKGVLGLVTGSCSNLVKRMYTGPLSLAAARVAFSASIESAGVKTVKLGKALTMLISSKAWWVAPSGPIPRPVWWAATITWRFW